MAAFTIVLEPGTRYWSDNYAWFTERYEDLWYLDRIAVDARWRRHGLATALYDEMELGAASHGRLCCEVDLDPPNRPSLAFHAARGYLEVGQRRDQSGKLLTMLEKSTSTVTSERALRWPCRRRSRSPERPSCDRSTRSAAPWASGPTCSSTTGGASRRSASTPSPPSATGPAPATWS